MISTIVWEPEDSGDEEMGPGSTVAVQLLIEAVLPGTANALLIENS